MTATEPGHRRRIWRTCCRHWPSKRKLGLGLLVAAILAATTGGLVQLRIDTSISSFLPANDPAMAAMEDKSRAFGGDPIIVLLESRDRTQLITGQDQLLRLLELEGNLSKLPDVAKVYGPGTAVNQVAIGARDLLAQISGHRDAIRSQAEQQATARGADPAAAAAAGRAATDGYDQRYGSLIVNALPAGLPTIKNPQFARAVVYDARTAEARPLWRAIVPTPYSVAILVRPRADLDQRGTSRLLAGVEDQVARSGLQTSRTTVSGIPAVTAALSDRAREEFPLLGALALVVVSLLYLLVPWSDRRRSRLRPVLAAVAGTTLTLAAFGWLGPPVSLGVVAFLPILVGIGSDFPLYLSQPGQRRRVLVAALAGAAGFAALAASSLPFVRELGIALAVGIIATAAVALVLRRWLDVLEPANRLPAPSSKPARAAASLPRLVRLVALFIVVLIAAAGWWALPNLQIEARPDRLAQGLPALEQADYIEKTLDASGEINVMLQGPDVLSPAALAWSRQAEDVVNRDFADQLHPITTVPDLLRFLGPQPTAAEIQAATNLLPTYLSSAVIRPDHHMSLMVFGVQIEDVATQSALVDHLRAALPQPPAGLQTDIVGLPVAAARGYDVASQSKVLVNVLAIVLAGLVLLIGLRERRDAGRAILTVLLSGGWVLALAWAFLGTLSPLTVAVGALSTATGCEFSIMLADARRRQRPWLLRSVALAAGAAVLGYSVLAFSELSILREFGLLLAASVLMSWSAAAAVIYVIAPPEPVAPDHSEADDADAATVTTMNVEDTPEHVPPEEAADPSRESMTVASSTREVGE